MVVSNRNPSWGTNRIAVERECFATSDSSTPPMVMVPLVGSASRDSSLARVVLPEPVSPTIATLTPAGSVRSTSRSTGWPGSYSKPTPRTCTSSAPPGSSTPGVGSTTSMGSSSRFRILCQPASAVWVWSSTSPISATGCTIIFARNTTAISVAAESPQLGPHHTPTPTTAARVRPLKMSETGNMMAKKNRARSWLRYWRSIAPLRRRRAAGTFA